MKIVNNPKRRSTVSRPKPHFDAVTKRRQNKIIVDRDAPVLELLDLSLNDVEGKQPKKKKNKQKKESAIDRYERSLAEKALGKQGTPAISRKNSKKQKLLETLWDCKTKRDVQRLFEAECKTFVRKVEKGVGWRKLAPELKETITQLIVRPGATGTPNLASQSVCNEAFKLLQERLAFMTKRHPDWDALLMTFIDGRRGTARNIPTIELAESQKTVKSILRKISPDYFGITEFCMFSNQRHTAGGPHIQVHDHALVFGPGVLRKAENVAREMANRLEPNITGAVPIDVKAVALDQENLDRLSAYMFKFPTKCPSWNPRKDGKPGFMNKSEKLDLGTNYLRLCQLRSLISIEQATFGGGEGSAIRSAMIKFLRALAVKDAGANGRVLHPDAVASFWQNVTQQLWPDWTLPVIQTHL